MDEDSGQLAKQAYLRLKSEDPGLHPGCAWNWLCAHKQLLPMALSLVL